MNSKMKASTVKPKPTTRPSRAASTTQSHFWIRDGRRSKQGFEIARSFANRHTTLAEHYLRTAEANRKTTAFSSSSSEWTYQACLRLAIRAFAGQLGQGYDPSDDMARLRALIDRIPGLSLRAHMWGEMAMQLFLRKHSDDAGHVVRDHVRTASRFDA